MPNLIPDADPIEDYTFGGGVEDPKADAMKQLEESFGEDPEDDDFEIEGVEQEEETEEAAEEEEPEAEEDTTTGKDDFESRQAELEAREKLLNDREAKLSTAVKIENLLQYEEFRKPILEMLEKASAPGFNWGTKDGESTRKLLAGFRDERVDEILAALPQLQEAAQAVQTAQARTGLDGMKNQFASQFGNDVVSDEVWKDIELSAARKYGQGLTYEQVELEAYKRLSGVGAKAARQLKELEGQPKGTRVLTGPTTRKQAREPDIDPRKLSPNDRQALIAKAL